MRNIERIPEMLEAIREVWEEHPNLRLGQLLMFALGRQKPAPTKKYFDMIKEKTGISVSTQIEINLNWGYLITPIFAGDIFGVEDDELLLQIRKTKVRLEGK